MNFSKIDPLLRQALREDAADRDITTRTLISAKVQGSGIFLAKQDLVLCGLPIVQRIFKILDPKVKLKFNFKDGDKIPRGKIIAQAQGKARSLLAGERLALNFLQQLSGIATETRRYVDQLKGTKAKLLDTRKTTPNLRLLERYAVRVGGGFNHRFDLASGFMAKDNHVALVGSVAEVVHRSKKIKGLPIVIEVKSLSELQETLAAGAKYLQLDNMCRGTACRAPTKIVEAVNLAKGKCLLEATGGVTLRNIRKIAQTGVNFISVGRLTHSAPAVDISFEMKRAHIGAPLQ